jgi:hypothetical protein
MPALRKAQADASRQNARPNGIFVANFVENETATNGEAEKPRKSGRNAMSPSAMSTPGPLFAIGAPPTDELRAAPTQIPEVSALLYRRVLLTFFVASSMSVSGRSERGPRSKFRSTTSSLWFRAHLVISWNPALSKEKCRIFSS